MADVLPPEAQAQGGLCTCGGKSVEREDGTVWLTHYGGCPVLIAEAQAAQDLATLRRLLDEGKVIRKAENTTAQFEARMWPKRRVNPTIVPKSKRRRHKR